MAILDVESLLAPASEDQPAGPNLEYEPDFASFESASRGKPEQQYGSTIIPAEEPDWNEVRRLGMELVTRTKDLRVGCLLARALLETGGFPDFAEGLSLVRGYLERYWSPVHPQLDPQDNNDPTVRVNTVAGLSDPATTVRSLRMVPMVKSRMLGQFSLRDFAVAQGEIPPALNEEAPQPSSIEASFAECDLDDLRANTLALQVALEHAEAIESAITQQVGVAQALSLENLRGTLGELHSILNGHLARREARPADEQVGTELGAAAGVTAEAPVRLTGEIRSREEAVLALEKVCEYYARHEPSSPLPLLLNRAKRLASKSFLEIIEDLTPDAVATVQSLGGVEKSAD